MSTTAIEGLLYERLKYYIECANYTVKTDSLKPDLVLNEILKILGVSFAEY